MIDKQKEAFKDDNFLEAVFYKYFMRYKKIYKKYK